ncbi:MAG TPA: primosomal protein N' [Marmoricola sp.]|nr:primosomal protein N' [Marmoricola sp.]
MSDPDGQLSLPGVARAEARKARPPKAKPPLQPAEVDPVAQVLVDLPLAHLDRPFDYAVPQTMSADAVPGARVKVRFGGQDVDGFVVARTATSEHPGRLQPLRRTVSPEPVLHPEIARLVAAVAHRYAGTRSDVLRLAVPPRHATTEKQHADAAPEPGPAPAPRSEAWPEAWAAYDGGSTALDLLGKGEPVRAVVSVAPADDGAELLAEAVVATAAAGRGALVCLPDRRDVARLDAALVRRLGADRHVVLTADAGPAKRYRAFLQLSRGERRIAIGTRAAAFAPVAQLGLVAIWDDGDDLHAEPRAPYPHVREVLLLRAQQSGCAALLAAHGRSVEAQYLVATGWAQELTVPREELRRRVLVNVTGDTAADLARDPFARSARLPREAFELVREAAASGPVLVQTPRSGYATRLACDRCRLPAHCARCHGPLRITAAAAPPACAWCGEVDAAWTCASCGGRGLRAPVLGDLRTAEEIGRALPLLTVRTSSGDRVLDTVPDRPAVVVATPGGEPVAARGYAAVLLMDTWLLLARSDLRADEEAVRRWANAAALVRPGGRVLVVGDPGLPPVQALVRWDPAGFATREMAERRSAHLPPASRVATLTVAEELADEVLAALVLPPGTEVLGPVAVEDARAEPQLRYVLRTPRRSGAALSEALRVLQAQRSTRKQAHVRVQVDPLELG